MLVKALQVLNASLPMLVTLFGMVTLVRLLQPANAPTEMLVTPFGIVKRVSCFPCGKRISVVLSLLYKTPFTEQ